MDDLKGFSALADVIHGQIGGVIQYSESNMAIDIGEIRSDGSLITNSCPRVVIPNGSYLICGSLFGVSCGGGTSVVDGHSHGCSVTYPDRIGRGDRVLVVWVGSDAVVVDTIQSGGV